MASFHELIRQNELILSCTAKVAAQIYFTSKKFFFQSSILSPLLEICPAALLQFLDDANVDKILPGESDQND